MAGPAEGRVPAIHVLRWLQEGVDGRDKYGHDDIEARNHPLERHNYRCREFSPKVSASHRLTIILLCAVPLASATAVD
jgi:hypothetical protein